MTETHKTDKVEATILFVDDEEILLKGIKKLLHKYTEWNLLFATSVNEALDLLHSNTVDTIISDINMPERDGFDLLKTVRNTENLKNIPVIILTGHSNRNMKNKALELGATDLLDKPIGMPDLSIRLKNTISIKKYQDTIKKDNELLEKRVKARTSELEASQMDIIWRMAKAAEYKDTDTGDHVIRVGAISMVIAEQLGLDNKFCQQIMIAAPLHDVGKIGIPDDILLKPGRLTAEEWDIMQSHCIIGASLLENNSSDWTPIQTHSSTLHDIYDTGVENPFLDMAAKISLHHHEHWNGSGYPYGLKGEEISIEGRIVALADTYDALSSERPYKPAFPVDMVVKILEENSHNFDPDVYSAFTNKIADIHDVSELYQGNLSFSEINQHHL